MGRSLIATEPCQICGDRSFGRHYGLWTCDGCSCFFKRSIRRNIRYTCISGENNCPVDKTRRNWCPACRLRKCLDMEMNVNAVQKERGPRRKKADLTENEKPSVKLMLPEKNLKEESSNASKSPKSSPINEATNKVNPTQLVTMPWTMGTEFAIDTTLIAALTNASKSSVIVFQSPEVKSIIMTKLWPLLYALYATQTSTLYASLAFDGGEGGITKTIQTHFNAGDNDLVPDGEEVRLLTCLLFCLQGAGSTTELAYAASLSDTYRFWLARHCTNFYGNDTTRFGKLIEFVEAISRIDLDGLTLFRLNFKLDPMTIIACLTAGAAKVQI